MDNNNVLNHNSMKKMNMQIVLDILRLHGKMSRAELARLLDCDGTTITNITRALAKLNLIVSHGSVSASTPGRPKELLTLNATAGYCIGLSFDPNSIYGIVVDLSGKIILRRQVHYEADITQEKFLTLLKKISENLINDIAGKKMLGISIATFGPLEPRRTLINSTKLFPAVNNLNLREYFYKTFKLTPQVIDATVAKTMTEIWNDPRPSEQKDFILIDAGVGIGATIVKKGMIIHSQEEYIGEFGHTVVCPGGEKCSCGMNGCLETESSIPALKKKIAGEGNTVTFNSIIERYQTGDPEVTRIVDDSARYLGLAIGNVINWLTPDKVILSGDLFELGNSYVCKLQKMVDEFTFPLFKQRGVTVQQSIYREEAAAFGATNLLLNNFFNSFHSEKSNRPKGDTNKVKELAV
jgi:predicted NBD/HSP70 family sugar kinase